MPPVARITAGVAAAHQLLRALERDLGHAGRARPRAGPAATAGAVHRPATVSRMQLRAEGCGLITTALRALMEMSALKIAVEVGFVEGIDRRHHAHGLRDLDDAGAGSSRRTPTVRSGRM